MSLLPIFQSEGTWKELVKTSPTHRIEGTLNLAEQRKSSSTAHPSPYQSIHLLLCITNCIFTQLTQHLLLPPTTVRSSFNYYTLRA